MIDPTPALSSAYDELLSRERPNDAQVFAATLEAEERVLADMDTFTDWLGGQCFLCDEARFDYIPRNDKSAGADAFRDKIATAGVPTLLALALRSHGWAGDAMTLIGDRYLSAHEGYVARLRDEALDRGA